MVSILYIESFEHCGNAGLQAKTYASVGTILPRVDFNGEKFVWMVGIDDFVHF